MEMGMVAQKFHNKVNFLLTVAHGEQRCSHASTLRFQVQNRLCMKKKGRKLLIIDMLSFEVVCLELEQLTFRLQTIIFSTSMASWKQLMNDCIKHLFRVALIFITMPQLCVDFDNHRIASILDLKAVLHFFFCLQNHDEFVMKLGWLLYEDAVFFSIYFCNIFFGHV